MRTFSSSSLSIFLLLLFSTLIFSTCASSQVLGLPLEEAAALMTEGNLDFIRQAELPPDFSQARSQLSQLLKIHPGAPFYAGLLIGRDASSLGRSLEILLFITALESPSMPVRIEAAKKLIPLILESSDVWMLNNILGALNERNLRNNELLHTLRAACYYSLGRYNDVIRILANWQDGESAAADWDKGLAGIAELAEAPSSTPRPPRSSLRTQRSSFYFEPHDSDFLRWLLAELNTFDEETRNNLLDPMEIIALNTRLRPDDYRSAANNLRLALHDGGTVFFRHPSLLGDLGRAFQYTPSANAEGAALFRAWAEMLEDPDLVLDLPQSFRVTEAEAEDETEEETEYAYEDLRELIRNMDEETFNFSKYMVLFYAGRITRAMGRSSESLAYFNQALEYSPNELQTDATLWYILNDTLAAGTNAAHEAAIELVLSTMDLWDNMATFAAIMDRLSSYMVRNRQWNTLLEFFNLLEERNAGTLLAQFAWITGRAAEEGYLTASRSPEEYFRITLEHGTASHYYRAMAAYKLGVTLTAERDNTRPWQRNTAGTELEFLLGLYEYGAAALARPYVNTAEDELEIPELRAISQAMADSGRLQESINFTSRYTRQAGYEIHRQDLYLSFPRLFTELVENYSREYDFGPEILFGLIHTESHFMANAVSRVGALGLTQLMPATAEDMANRIFRQEGFDYRGANFRDPEINVHIGSYYLRNLTNLMGSPMLALIAYNGGQGRLRRWLAEDSARGVLPQDLFLETIEFAETREYGRRVLGAASVYGYIYYGMSMEETAADIFSPLP